MQRRLDEVQARDSLFTRSGGDAGTRAQLDPLLRERQGITNADRMADEILAEVPRSRLHSCVVCLGPEGIPTERWDGCVARAGRGHAVHGTCACRTCTRACLGCCVSMSFQYVSYRCCRVSSVVRCAVRPVPDLSVQARRCGGDASRSTPAHTPHVVAARPHSASSRRCRLYRCRRREKGCTRSERRLLGMAGKWVGLRACFLASTR